MASISTAQIERDLKAILKGADLSQLSAKKVRRQLEDKYGKDLSEKKKDIDSILMKIIEDGQSEEEETSKPIKRTHSKTVTNGNDTNTDDEVKGESLSASDSESDFEAPEESTPIKKKAKLSKKKMDDEELARQLQEEEEGEGRLTRGRRACRGKPAAPRKKIRVKKEGAPKRENKYTEACHLSPSLAHVVGTDRMKRSDVVKRMWEVVRERELQDPKNKQFMLCDEELYKVFGKKRVRTFGMMKYLKSHIFSADEVLGLSE